VATNKIYVVTDLGPGDGGKGGVVHSIATRMRAHTVIKVGGAQGSHGVRTSRGERFAFSQWGCGTFEGIRTHLSHRIVVTPEGILNEADALRFEHGVHDPFALLTVDERALCASPYHRIASSIIELARGNDPRGTIGSGVGVAVRMAARFPDLVIRVRDLTRPDLRDRIAATRAQVRHDLAPLFAGDFLPEDRAMVEEERELLNDDGLLDYVEHRFREASKQARIVGPEYLGQVILAREGAAVVESSHGVLTDVYRGFHPHTSALRTLPCFTRAMLEDAGFRGKIVNLGVTRGYQIRHGAGPLPTENPSMSENLLPGSNKDENRYQGKVRVGPMDLVLNRYAIDACGGPEAFDGLAITWFDQIQVNGEWHVCHRYANADDPDFFTPAGMIKVRHDDDDAQLAHQEALGRRLFACVPELSTHRIPQEMTQGDVYALCAETLKDALGVPVRLVSFGPTERDKVLR